MSRLQLCCRSHAVAIASYLKILQALGNLWLKALGWKDFFPSLALFCFTLFVSLVLVCSLD